jgi:2-phospho-L-lactate guanylyltransferase
MAFPTTDLWVVIPVKPPRESKRRLKDFGGSLRAGLALAMLQDVLTALQGANTIKEIVIVTLDAEIARLAAGQRVQIVEEAGPFGMNRAIAQGCEYAKTRGATSLVVIPLDIPLLTAAEFDRLVDELRLRSRTSDGPVLGIVPAAGRGGTNWMCFGTEKPFPPLYGEDSYQRHLDQARSQRCRTVTLDSPTVSLDVDEASDLEAFASICHQHPEFQATRTWQFLDRHWRDSGAGKHPVK